MWKRRWRSLDGGGVESNHGFKRHSDYELDSRY
jgi:hypothetical protein